MPIRRSPANRSTLPAASAITRSTMPITARQVTCSSVATVDAALRAASHATVSSNAVMNREPCLAHGTAITVGPCSQFTRGTSASNITRTVYYSPGLRCR
jgi:hypothetical protein